MALVLWSEDLLERVGSCRVFASIVFLDQNNVFCKYSKDQD